MTMATYTLLVIFSIFLLQVAGEAFPTIILSQNDGVFPNVTNSTGTASVTSPTGDSVIITPANQVKRYNSAGQLIDNDEILPGYGKEKRQRNTCHAICAPAHFNDLCHGTPSLVSCNDDCSVEIRPLAPLDGTRIGHQADAIHNADQLACLSHCSCTHGGGHLERFVDDGSNGDNPFEGLD
ncbi:hypothetical protein F5883DRAFT_718550 [Diaporthe sp. PMI_573]|nr:hypothetical protein F5883DRAFT_718550 [Diaporthaceae sp. PMI_573]